MNFAWQTNKSQNLFNQYHEDNPATVLEFLEVRSDFYILNSLRNMYVNVEDTGNSLI